MGKITKSETENSGIMFDKALNYIFIRIRTEKEIRKYLSEKGCLNEIIDEVVDKLKEYRYLDDREFASAFIAAHRKKWGIKKLRMELKLHGINEPLLSESLEEIDNQDEEAYALAEKYLKSKSKFEEHKLYTHLAQKGFDNDSIKAAVRRLRDETEEENL